MGTAFDRASTTEPPTAQQAAGTTQASELQPAGNQAAMEAAGLSRAPAGPPSEPGGRGPRRGRDWKMTVEDENGYVMEGPDARIRLGCTVVLTRDLGERMDPADV